jgi:hypothetical protein
MASTVVDISGVRNEERAVEAPERSTIASRILSANALVQGIAPTLGALIKSVGLPALILALVVLNFPAISNAVGELPGVAARLKSFEAGGFKAELVSADLVRPAFKDIENAPEVAAAIKKLAPEQFDRLAFLRDGAESCVYAKASATLYRFVALDHELQDMKLITLTDAPAAVARHKADASPDAEKRRAEMGDPVRCYTLQTTELGWQAKNAVIKIVSQTFNGRIDLR